MTVPLIDQIKNYNCRILYWLKAGHNDIAQELMVELKQLQDSQEPQPISEIIPKIGEKNMRRQKLQKELTDIFRLAEMQT